MIKVYNEHFINLHNLLFFILIKMKKMYHFNSLKLLEYHYI